MKSLLLCLEGNKDHGLTLTSLTLYLSHYFHVSPLLPFLCLTVFLPILFSLSPHCLSLAFYFSIPYICLSFLFCFSFKISHVLAFSLYLPIFFPTFFYHSFTLSRLLSCLILIHSHSFFSLILSFRSIFIGIGHYFFKFYISCLSLSSYLNHSLSLSVSHSFFLPLPP